MKYRIGQKPTYKPLNQTVTVVHVTPYHDDADKYAVVYVRKATGEILPVPVAVQDEYLTLDPPRKTGPGLKNLFGILPAAKPQKSNEHPGDLPEK